MFAVTCPHCRRRLQLPEEVADRELICPVCSHTLRRESTAGQHQEERVRERRPFEATQPTADLLMVSRKADVRIGLVSGLRRAIRFLISRLHPLSRAVVFVYFGGVVALGWCLGFVWAISAGNPPLPVAFFFGALTGAVVGLLAVTTLVLPVVLPLQLLLEWLVRKCRKRQEAEAAARCDLAQTGKATDSSEQFIGQPGNEGARDTTETAIKAQRGC